jgi:hypothetical protein
MTTINRRLFTGALAGLAATRTTRAADSDRRTRFYWLETFQLQQGTQPGRMNEWFRNGLIPRLAKIHPGPVIVLEAQIAPHTPQIMLIIGFSSFEEIGSVRSKVMDDESIVAADRKLNEGVQPPFETQTTTLLEAAPYSPEIVAEKRDTPRLFELRVYHSPRFSQLQALHQRFSGAEIKIFHRSGIHPVLYGSTIIGGNQPNLTYLIPFDSLAAREKAWAAFGADPEWVKVRQESVEKYGQITAVNDIAIYRATAYSPIR